ncbi:spermidine synthase [Georgenia deserti]|uniref:Spermidine synthase n=1 Tax=Georgenia deserti TaxID=2093781 RepID=A0ABW4L449_9MICO
MSLWRFRVQGTPDGDDTAMEHLARTRSERGELALSRRPSGDLELRVNGVFVMDTADVTTERMLAAAALRTCADPAAVLVGGLGLGFTLAEVLADPRVERCVVVEIEPDVVTWMRDGTVAHGPELLADARVEVLVADVADVLMAASAEFDLVLLDVDNGPGYLVHERNRELYEQPALTRLCRALRPGGVLAVWSSAPAPELHEALSATFAAVQVSALPVRLQDRDEEYVLYSART